MSVTVQDVLNLVEDYAGANTGQVDVSRKIRQISNSLSYFQRKGLLPNNEGIYSFYFSDDQFFYAVPTNFMEEMELLYNNPALNVQGREWEFEEYSRLLKRTGSPASKNKWSFTTINGTRQLVLLGSNFLKGILIDDMEEVGTWVVQGDASALAVDSLDFKVGDASLSFAVSAVSSGFAGINDPSVSLDLQTLFEKHGYIKYWVKLPSAAIDAIRLRIYTSNTKYWTITATANDDGTPFVANIWSKIGWAFDSAVKTSTPLITDDIVKIEIEVDLGAAFTTGTFRFDQIFSTIPDYMDLFYRSNAKGTNAAGTALQTLTAVTDVIGVCELFPDFDDLIARRAAINLWPQLRADKDFMVMYKEELKEMMRDIGMRFPRKRTNKFLPTRLLR